MMRSGVDLFIRSQTLTLPSIYQLSVYALLMPN
jgi:hypothetical protein